SGLMCDRIVNSARWVGVSITAVSVRSEAAGFVQLPQGAGYWHSRGRLPRRGVAAGPGDRVTLALHRPAHHAGHRLHYHPVARLAVKEIEEGAELGGRDHVRTALRVRVAQVVEDEDDPGAALGLRGRFGVEHVLLEGGELRRLLDRRYRADRVRVGR